MTRQGKQGIDRNHQGAPAMNAQKERTPDRSSRRSDDCSCQRSPDADNAQILSPVMTIDRELGLTRIVHRRGVEVGRRRGLDEPDR